MTTYCRKPFQTYGDKGHGYYYCELPQGHDGCETDYRHESNGKIKDQPVVTLGAECPNHDTKCVQLDIWRRVVVDGKETPYARRDKGRRITDIFRELKAQLESENLLDESFSICPTLEYGQDPDKRRDLKVECYQLFGKWHVEWTPPGRSDRIKETYEVKGAAEQHADRIRAMYAQTPPMLDRTTDKVGRWECDALWPDNVRWIACYAVTGGSEGHYVHVDAIQDIEHTAIGTVRVARGIFMAKTFQGLEHAQKLADRLGALLGC